MNYPKKFENLDDLTEKDFLDLRVDRTFDLLQRLHSIKKALNVENSFDLKSLEAQFCNGSEDYSNHKVRLKKLISALLTSEPYPHDKPVYILFTSGSTGQPKGVMIVEKSLLLFIKLITT